ncbi:MAG: RluA family pseudouridine synthase [Gemmatimonadota bacterium]|nr:RluA family pseudouridine synthase [Gemmatimonadota bacterium]
MWRTGTGASGRLDLYLARRLDLSRSRIQALLEEGHVRVDGARPKKSDRIGPGQLVEVEVPPPVPLVAAAQDIPLEIIFQDEDVVVVDKQPGLVVHPAPGHPDGTLVNALLYHIGDLSGIGGKLRPGIVHRLDMDTSGLMVVAKTDRAHQRLAGALKAREVKRTYLATIWGTLKTSPTIVDRPIGRHPRHRLRMAVVPEGRPARTRFRHLEAWTAASMYEVALETGRTHQIRVHAASIGHPVVGDALYGAGRERGVAGPQRPWAAALAKRTPRQFLHAHRLQFDHPVSGKTLVFESGLPGDLAAVREWAVSHGKGPVP